MSGLNKNPEAERLAEEHSSIVEPIVRQLASHYPRHVDRDDLRGAGAFGLVHAARRFDPKDGVPFANYARHRIRGAVLDEVRARDWAPRSLRRRLREIAAATTTLEHRLGRHPMPPEIATELGVAIEVIESARAQSEATVLLSAELPATPEDDIPIAEQLLEQDTALLPAEAAERAQMLRDLANSLEALPRRLRRILVEHDLQGRPMGVIASDLGVSDARASQLRHEGILALRALFGLRYEDVPTVPEHAPGKAGRASMVEAALGGVGGAGHVRDTGIRPLGRQAW